jgi:hypothetical protein
MSGRHSRNKGQRGELALVHLLQDNSFAAEKISGLYKRGADISVPLLGVDRIVEVKIRADGFRELYRWLNERDLLIVRSDRHEPLVVLPMSLAIKVAKIAERAHAERERKDLAHEKHVADIQETLDSEFGK